MASIGLKANIDPWKILYRIIMVVVGLWVIQLVVGILVTTADTNDTNGMFYQAYKFLGLTQSTGAAYDQGVLLIAAIFLALSVLASVLDVKA